MKKFAMVVAAATLAAAPHLASAAPALSLTGLPVVGPVLGGVGGLVNGLPVVGPVVKGVLTGGGTGNLLAVGALVPVVLNVALPVVTDLAPTLAQLHLPIGNLVPVVLNVALPLVDKAAPVVAPIISGVGGLAGGLVSGL